MMLKIYVVMDDTTLMSKVLNLFFTVGAGTNIGTML